MYFVALFPSFQSTFQNTKIIIAFASDIISLLTNRMRKFRRVLIDFDLISHHIEAGQNVYSVYPKYILRS